MTDEAWAFESSIVCEVALEFAWRFWTDISNWALDADVESVTLDGDFAAGSRGVTQSKSSGRIEWRVASGKSRDYSGTSSQRPLRAERRTASVT